MAILIGLLFVLFPIFSLPFVLIGYFYDQKRNVFYSILFGIIMGLFAYYLQPPVSYDLYRHHQLVDEFSTYSASYFFKALSDTSEPIQALVNFGVSLTHNHDLLQFSIVAAGYSILLYILGDFTRRNNIKKSSLFVVLLFTLASFTCINFFSGLWNYIAILVFALGFYWDMSRHKSKWLTYSLYIATPLIHSGMFFPVILIIIFKLFGEKINIRSMAAMLAVFVAPSVLLPLINSLVAIPIFAQLEPMYNAYFLNGSQFLNLYGGDVMVMELLKLALCVAVCFVLRESIVHLHKIRNFVLLLSFSTLLLVANSIVFFRFVLLIQFIALPILLVYFDTKINRTKFFMYLYTFVISLVFVTYQYMTLRSLDFDPLSLGSGLLNIVQVFIK